MGSELYGIKQRSGRADILGAKSNIIYKYTKGIEEQIVKGKTKIQEVMIMIMIYDQSSILLIKIRKVDKLCMMMLARVRTQV